MTRSLRLVRRVSLAGLGTAAVLLGAGAPAARATEPRLWPDLSQTISLRTEWSYLDADEPRGADPALDDSAWPRTTLPGKFVSGEGESGITWYRIRVRITDPRLAQPLGLDQLDIAATIGKVNSAYQVYAGGLLLGGVGRLPPDAEIDYDRHRTYRLPKEAVGPDGSLVLALRVWKSEGTRSGRRGAPYEGPLLLGPHEELLRREVRAELPVLLFVALFFALALFHLEVYQRRKGNYAYFWFSLASAEIALYGLLRSQWKYAFGDHFMVYKELEHGLIYGMLATAIQLIFPVLGMPINRLLRFAQWLSVAVGLLVSLTPGLRLNLLLLPLWQAGLMAVLASGLWLVVRQAVQGREDAWITALGAAFAALMFVHDILVDRGRLDHPRIALVGFFGMMLSIAATLARQFHRMTTELEALREDLERRVQERTHQLFEANQAKGRFLATISHEIRSPLNGVLGMTQMLLASDLKPEQRQYAEIVRRSGSVLLALLDDILDVSRIEAGKLELEQQDFDLHGYLEEAVDVFSNRASEKGLDLAFWVDPALPRRLRGDPFRLQQILFNLIGNAVKFTERGGVFVRVEVSAKSPPPAERVELRFSVEDTGIGIAPEDAQRIFEAFNQVDASHSRRFGGSGLGLAICRQLTELMGGRIWLESQPGSGSAFHFEVNLRVVEVGKPESWAQARPELAGKSILVVAPGSVTRRVLLELCRLWEMLPTVVTSVDEGLALAGGPSPPSFAVLGPAGEEPSSPAQRRALSELTRKLPTVAIERPRLAYAGARGGESGVMATVLAPVKPRELLAALLGRPVEAAVPNALVAAREEAGTSARAILVADDEEINRQVCLLMLRQLGLEADLARDGFEVLEALARRPYDLILLDIRMPGMDGLETLRRIRAGSWPEGKMPRVVALTAHTSDADRSSFLAAGMDGYLSKPLELEALAAVLRGLPPPAVESPSGKASPVLEATIFDRLSALDDGRGSVQRDLVALFARRAPTQLDAVATACVAGDLAQAARVLHSLKGSSGMLGGLAVMASCEAFERELANGPDPSLWQPRLVRLQVELDQLLAELDLRAAASGAEADTAPGP
ncbi:MAG: ATP-binding protein [Thermoanaerobaculia bacterium]